MLALPTVTAWLLAIASAHPLLQQKVSLCPSISSGTINIDSYQLYPENVDFNEQSCLLWYVREFKEKNYLGLYNKTHD